LRGPRLKPEQPLYGLSPPKLALEGIEPETFGGANSKIPSQPQMGYFHYYFTLTKSGFATQMNLKNQVSRLETYNWIGYKKLTLKPLVFHLKIVTLHFLPFKTISFFPCVWPKRVLVPIVVRPPQYGSKVLL